MNLLIFLIIVGIVLPFLPIDAGVRNIIIAVLAVIALLWAFRLLGYGHGLRLGEQHLVTDKHYSFAAWKAPNDFTQCGCGWEVR